MKKAYIYSSLTIFGIIMLESPFILLANRIKPLILGMPFFLFWVLLWWLFCTVVLFIAFRKNWGKDKT